MAAPEAAKTIYDNMKVGARSTDHIAVKRAYESVYKNLGITCEDVGGLWFDAEDRYYATMEPCDSSDLGIQSGALRASLGALSFIGAAIAVCLSL